MEEKECPGLFCFWRAAINCNDNDGKQTSQPGDCCRHDQVIWRVFIFRLQAFHPIEMEKLNTGLHGFLLRKVSIRVVLWMGQRRKRQYGRVLPFFMMVREARSWECSSEVNSSTHELLRIPSVLRKWKENQKLMLVNFLSFCFQ